MSPSAATESRAGLEIVYVYVYTYLQRPDLQTKPRPLHPSPWDTPQASLGPPPSLTPKSDGGRDKVCIKATKGKAHVGKHMCARFMANAEHNAGKRTARARPTANATSTTPGGARLTPPSEKRMGGVGGRFEPKRSYDIRIESCAHMTIEACWSGGEIEPRRTTFVYVYVYTYLQRPDLQTKSRPLHPSPWDTPQASLGPPPKTWSGIHYL